jgi:integrase
MPSNKLTQVALRAATPREKPYKLGDGDGLYLLINPNGSRWWRLKYHFEAREKLLALGVFPHVTLQHARSLRDEAKRAIVNGVDPSVKKQIEKWAHSNTFEAIAREWLTLQEQKLALRSGSRPMSDNTVNAALRRLGYTSEEMTGHGFRSLASTCLNEQGYHPDLIELQLAHAERNQVRAAYNKAQRLPERRKMMEAWADYLDGLRAGAST